jgi:CRP-like cAMP-binding protein
MINSLVPGMPHASSRSMPVRRSLAKSTSECSSCTQCPAAHRSVFNQVPFDGRDVLAASRVELTVALGQPVPLRRGSVEGVVCIRSGYVKVSHVYAKRSRPVRICGPGDLVGYGYWHCDTRMVPEALEDTSGCFFEKKRFLVLQREVPEISEQLIKLLGRIALQKSQRISSLQSRAVRSRVAALLTSLERKFGERTPQGSRIGVRVDRRTMAALSGTVIETLSRALTDFEKQGFIARDGRTVYVLNMDALNALAHEA